MKKIKFLFLMTIIVVMGSCSSTKCVGEGYGYSDEKGTSLDISHLQSKANAVKDEREAISVSENIVESNVNGKSVVLYKKNVKGDSSAVVCNSKYKDSTSKKGKKYSSKSKCNAHIEVEDED